MGPAVQPGAETARPARCVCYFDRCAVRASEGHQGNAAAVARVARNKSKDAARSKATSSSSSAQQRGNTSQPEQRAGDGYDSEADVDGEGETEAEGEGEGGHWPTRSRGGNGCHESSAEAAAAAYQALPVGAVPPHWLIHDAAVAVAASFSTQGAITPLISDEYDR